ncbi:expressed protein [Phakopsora pachyrhizi]|uniref:Expressed protein n=1 Tax=Phakopsora pachyrhizi TaxID=170000 RepID=A0AAV0AZR2_PHAPC|nr:expressed protein [Phakopsora pachyrhizi]
MCKHFFNPCSYVQAIFQALFLCPSIFKPLIMCSSIYIYIYYFFFILYYYIHIFSKLSSKKSEAWEEVRIKTVLFFILSFFIFNSTMYRSSTIAHSSSCQVFLCCSSLSYVL